MACAATDAEYQNRINLPYVAQQPHLDHNYATHTEARRVAGA